MDEDKTGYPVLKDLISETFDPRGGDDGWQEQEVDREEYYRTSELVVRIAKEQEIDLDFDFDGVEID